MSSIQQHPQSNWIKSGILYVKDLQFTNGKVDETFIFEVVKQKSNLLLETLKVKTALNSYTNILQQIPLNARSLDKQDSVEIKEWSTKKLTAKQVQHKGIESSFGPLNVLSIPGWEWSGSSHYLQNALMVMRLTQPLTAKS